MSQVQYLKRLINNRRSSSKSNISLGQENSTNVSAIDQYNSKVNAPLQYVAVLRLHITDNVDSVVVRYVVGQHICASDSCHVIRSTSLIYLESSIW